jgi:hypothetical protein
MPFGVKDRLRDLNPGQSAPRKSLTALYFFYTKRPRLTQNGYFAATTALNHLAFSPKVLK